MSKNDMMSAIYDCLVFCQAHTCPTCPKIDDCSVFFDDHMVESKIYDLSVKCRKLNECKET